MHPAEWSLAICMKFWTSQQPDLNLTATSITTDSYRSDGALPSLSNHADGGGGGSCGAVGADTPCGLEACAQLHDLGARKEGVGRTQVNKALHTCAFW